MSLILVLWDIDHTLIETRGVGGQVYAEAFHRATGQLLDQMPALAGRTEPAIFREALALHGINDPDRTLFDRFASEQARGYTEHADELRTRGRALPGAEDVLRMFGQRDDVVQSVLTGNTRPSAEVKLRVFGLDSYVDWDIGAYGTDADDRPGLVEVARHRAEKVHGQPFDAARTVMVGDTPNDVVAARQGGARIVAIATGSSSAGELAAAGADAVFEDLTCSDGLLTAIYGVTGQHEGDAQ